jgi:predicted Rossmann-fold nucleotide-binding protein
MKKLFKRPLHVAFFGGNDVKKSDPNFVDAYDTAQLLAKNKCTILNGGGPGIMYASTLGAKSVHGRVEVVAIDKSGQPTKHYEGQFPENTSLANRVFTLDTYHSRLNKLIKLAHAYVIFYGGTGTLAELTFVWSEAKFAYPRPKPIIFFGKKWRKIIDTINKELNLEKMEQHACHFANSPDDVLKILKDYSK